MSIRTTRRELLKSVSDAGDMSFAAPVINRHSGVRLVVKGIPGARAIEPTTIEHELDHFDYGRSSWGPEHLGIGGDIDLNSS